MSIHAFTPSAGQCPKFLAGLFLSLPLKAL